MLTTCWIKPWLIVDFQLKTKKVVLGLWAWSATHGLSVVCFAKLHTSRGPASRLLFLRVARGHLPAFCVPTSKWLPTICFLKRALTLLPSVSNPLRRSEHAEHSDKQFYPKSKTENDNMISTVKRPDYWNLIYVPF